MKVAGAPITWGVSEVPGWGHQMAHLKDVDERLAVQVQAGAIAYSAAVRAGLYQPLGVPSTSAPSAMPGRASNFSAQSS